MKRLLCIVGSMDAGGAETFLMKIYRQLDKTKYQMDFAVAVKEGGFYDKEILEMGGVIHHITPKSKGLIQNFTSIIKLVKRNKYRYVMRISQHSLSALELLASWMGGAKIRVFRSSNTNTTSSNRINQLLHKLFMFMPALFSNVKIAPSTEAALFMFGKHAVNNHKVIILPNGLNLDNFTFDSEIRDKYRKDLNLENKKVIGHVGRFAAQKNHDFLIDIFSHYHKSNPESVLLLIGEGDLVDQIMQKVQRLGLSDSVLFLGLRKDVSQLLFAMDAFLFPSYYEGMPNTVIEAQATGLPCLISDTITKEADLTGLVSYYSLNNNAALWAKELEYLISCNDRFDFVAKLKKMKYDIHTVTKQFEQVVFKE